MKGYTVKRREPFNILQIFTFSCLLFFLLSIFSVYKYKIYSQWSLFLFYVYEMVFWLGIKTGKIHFKIGKNLKIFNGKYNERLYFLITKQGQIVIYSVFVGALLSFAYFLFLYRGSFDIASFGASLKAEFDEVARTKLEVVTQFIMFAGSAVYLIVIGAKSSVSQTTLKLARICLFLPGLRGAFLGRRFTLAIETLIFLFAESETISKKVRNLGVKDKKTIRRVVLVLVVAMIVMVYIFSQRIVYMPETMLIANSGDMQLKPFWNRVYSKIGNRMSLLAYISFYSSHAPYAFSYSNAYVFPNYPRYWGLSTFRVCVQIITSLFGLHPNYAEMAYQVPGIARYTGYAGTVIQDFGKILSFPISFLFGFIFSKIENGKSRSSICLSLYPLVQVACLFAPVYFFSVGNIDQIAIWALILSPICLTRKSENSL